MAAVEFEGQRGGLAAAPRGDGLQVVEEGQEQAEGQEPARGQEEEPQTVTLPVPVNSRSAAITASAIVNPIPMPTPSAALLRTPFLEANASARPRMMQFTTMSGMKIPSFSHRA